MYTDKGALEGRLASWDENAMVGCLDIIAVFARDCASRPNDELLDLRPPPNDELLTKCLHRKSHVIFCMFAQKMHADIRNTLSTENH